MPPSLIDKPVKISTVFTCPVMVKVFTVFAIFHQQIFFLNCLIILSQNFEQSGKPWAIFAIEDWASVECSVYVSHDLITCYQLTCYFVIIQNGVTLIFCQLFSLILPLYQFFVFFVLQHPTVSLLIFTKYNEVGQWKVQVNKSQNLVFIVFYCICRNFFSRDEICRYPVLCRICWQGSVWEKVL